MDKSLNVVPLAGPARPDSRPIHCETYATLSNRSIILPSASAGYFAVEQHFFFDLMERVLAQVQIDEDWYLAKHPDVRDAIRRGVVQSARQHYARFGYYEHRLPYAIEVNEKWYIDAYPDVKDAIQNGVHKSGQSHFELAGFREGRMPHANFQLRLAGG